MANAPGLGKKILELAQNYVPLLLLVLVALVIVLSLLTLFLTLYQLIKLYIIKQITPVAATSFIEINPPHNASKSPYSTTQLFNILYGIGLPVTTLEKLFRKRKSYSLEILSTKTSGIRYFLSVPTSDKEIIRRAILAYLPGAKITETTDYLPDISSLRKQTGRVVSFKLTNDFYLPLQLQKSLIEADPIAYITSAMAQLKEDELMALQLVVKPVKETITNRVAQLEKRLLNNSNNFTATAQNNSFNILRTPLYLIKLLVFTLGNFVTIPLGISVFILTRKNLNLFPLSQLLFGVSTPTESKSTSSQEDLTYAIRKKIEQYLFETSFRIMLLGSRSSIAERERGFVGSLALFTNQKLQSYVRKEHLNPVNWPELVISRIPKLSFKMRRLTTPTMILAASELADLYHFPVNQNAVTEDLVKVLSPELLAPLPLKNGREFDVVFAKNTYGNNETDIGLTDEERAKHVFMIGRTGSGKSTILFHMAAQDIKKGRGLAVIDPHGDLAEDLLATVPEERINDLIYFNPWDLSHPIGINLLELPEGVIGDELELEKELVAESVISIFRRIFAQTEQTNAHRIEYILRNTIYTSFSVPSRTIFTVYNLLNNPQFRNKVVGSLTDPDLKNFWKNEFGRAGDYQVISMISGVTAKVGRFLFSPTAKRVLEQEKSTINFDDILGQGKILICNLAEGKIGEDTAQILGLTVISKIHQAALRRTRSEIKDRTPFYLFVDEFQNFATSSFTKILSGGRKFGLRLTLAEQSTAQQEDRNVVNVILANTGTVICFATASPLDEQMMQPQFAPFVSNYDLANLARYNFYIKMAATIPQEPFSGQTLKIAVIKNQEKIKKLITASRRNYTTVYQAPKIEITGETTSKDAKNIAGTRTRRNLAFPQSES